jgi:hypothetical protein
MKANAQCGERAVVAARVRQNVVPAAIGAGFLLYFGYLHLAEPTGTDLFNRANWVFYHTLRLDGLAMAAVALWSMRGQGITLAVDALVAALIGVLLILTGLVMAIDGGDMLQTVINVVCGVMFISSGLRNWKDYRFFSAADASTATIFPSSEPPDFRRPTRTLPDVRAKAPSPFQGEGKGEGRIGNETLRSPAPPPTPPEGFLAALAKKTPPPDAGDEGSHT